MPAVAVATCALPSHTLTLPRQAKIRRRADFAVCYKLGARYYSTHFLVFLHTGTRSDEQTRIGMAVSRKVGNAVTRNRIKRLLREFFRLHFDALPAKADLVAVAKKNAGDARLDLSCVAAELLPLLKRIARTGGQDLPT